MMLPLNLTTHEYEELSRLFPDMSTDEAAHYVMDQAIDRRKKQGPEQVCSVLFFRRKEDQNENVYAVYERGKRLLFEANLDADEYEKAVVKLAESLGI